MTTAANETEMTLVQAVTDALACEMRLDDRVIILGEDVGINGGVFRATEGLQAEFGADRVVDSPLAESGIIGSSIGLAMNGMRPVPELQFEGFMGPAYDQLCSHAARFRTRTRGRFSVPMTVRVPHGGGIHAPELHSDAPEAIYAHQPGLKVVMPATPYDAKGLLIASIRDPDPVIFFEPKRIYRAFREHVPNEAYTLPIGKARVVTEGTDLTVVAWGAMVVEAAKAAEQSDASVELIDLRTINVVDEDTILASVEKTAVRDLQASLTLGLASEISSLVTERCFLHLEAPVQRVAGSTPLPTTNLRWNTSLVPIGSVRPSTKPFATDGKLVYGPGQTTRRQIPFHPA